MISYESVSFEREGRTILSDFSLELPEGGRVLATGKTGSGKSTLFRFALGLECPDSGRVLYRGKPLDRQGMDQVRVDAAYVPQNTDVHDGSVASLVDRIFSYRANQHQRPSRGEIRSRLDRFELPAGVLEQEFRRLSGGERQRVLLAVALLLNRNLFLLDEVSSALDDQMSRRVLSVIEELEGITVFAVSHDPVWMESDSFQRISIPGRKEESQ